MSDTALTFGATSGFGTFAGWELQSDTPNTQKDRANTLGPTGDEVSANLFNAKTEFTSVYKASADTNTVPASIGKLYNSRILTSIALSTSNGDRATMTLTGHNHAANAHADTLKQVAHGMTVTMCFGAIDFLGGTGTSGSAVASSSVTITCQHDDKMDNVGGHLIGQNYDAKMEGKTTWTGTVSVAAASGWDVTSNEVPTANTDFITTSVTGTKPLTFAAPGV